MKKTILTLAAFVAASVLANAQDTEKPTSFVEIGYKSTQSLMMKGDLLTAYTWLDTDGKEYAIILHTYTKGEKAGRTTAYVIRKSKKSGKDYRYFLPDGEKIAKEIMREMF